MRQTPAEFVVNVAGDAGAILEQRGLLLGPSQFSAQSLKR